MCRIGSPGAKRRHFLRLYFLHIRVLPITTSLSRAASREPPYFDEKLREWAERSVPEADDSHCPSRSGNSTGKALSKESLPGSVSANSGITVRKRPVAESLLRMLADSMTTVAAGGASPRARKASKTMAPMALS
jgi:hypothetical protein